MGLRQTIKNSFVYPMISWLPSTDKRTKTNLSRTIAPIQLQRLRADIGSWREAIQEAENAYWPHRVKMQRIFIDTVLNGHIASAIEKRRDLTLLREFEFVENDKVNEKVTEYFKKASWFERYQTFTIDAIFYGYSLIALGDLDKDQFKDISAVRRWDVSPDRLNVPIIPYGIYGAQFLEEPFADWHIWVPTTGHNGDNNCGYGLLYNLALYEIFLRNNLGFNADFIELFAMPYRHGKTEKKAGDERDAFEQALIAMGAAGYALTDKEDEIVFLESKNSGTAYQSYDNFEARIVKVINKLILGHADAMDSVPGKLGAGGDKDDNPITIALSDKQTKDGRFLEIITNEQLLPKMRKIGFNIPEGVTFRFKNSDEAEEIREREDTNNKLTAEIAQVMKNAGLQMDANYFTERTGIPATAIAEPVAPLKKDPLTQDVKNKLQKFYSGH